MALIQSVGLSGGVSSSATITASQAGSTIIILVGTTGATPTVSDNLGTVYTKISVPGPITPLYCFYARVAAGVTTITFTSFGNCVAFINEESGLASNIFDSISVGYYNSSGATNWITNPVNVSTSSGVGYVFTQYTGSAGMSGFGVNSPWSLLSGTGITGGVVTNSSYGSQAGAGRRTISASGTYSGTGVTGTSWYPDAFVIFFKSSPQMRMSSNLSLTTTSGGAIPTSTDDFNRSDTAAPNLGGNWGVYTGITNGGQVLSNRASAVANFTCRNYYNVTLTNDQYAQATVANTNYGGVGLILRSSSSAASGYYCDFWGQPAGGIEIYYRQDSATTTMIANTAYDSANTVSLGDIIKADVVGNIITAYVNGVPKLSVSNTSLTSGVAGIFLDASGLPASAASLDNFVAGNVTATSNTTVNYGQAVQITNLVEQAYSNPVTKVTQNYWNNTTGPYSITPTAGNMLVFSVLSTVGGGDPYITSLQTNTGQNFTSAIGTSFTISSMLSTTFGAGTWCMSHYYLPVVGSGVTSISVTYNNGGSGTLDVLITEFSGMSSTPLLRASYGKLSGTATSDPVYANALVSSGAPASLVYAHASTSDNTNGMNVTGSGWTQIVGGTGYRTVAGYAKSSGFGSTSYSAGFDPVGTNNDGIYIMQLEFASTSNPTPRLYANGTYVCSQFIEQA